MDKTVIKFFADVMYLKGVICHDEFLCIMEACSSADLEEIVEKILNEEFNVLRGKNKAKIEVMHGDY